MLWSAEPAAVGSMAGMTTPQFSSRLSPWLRRRRCLRLPRVSTQSAYSFSQDAPFGSLAHTVNGAADWCSRAGSDARRRADIASRAGGGFADGQVAECGAVSMPATVHELSCR
jgi:hypothetical protein